MNLSCPSCGEKYSIDANFCMSCGVSFNHDVSEEVIQNSEKTGILFDKILTQLDDLESVDYNLHPIYVDNIHTIRENLIRCHNRYFSGDISTKTALKNINGAYSEINNLQNEYGYQPIVIEKNETQLEDNAPRKEEQRLYNQFNVKKTESDFSKFAKYIRYLLAGYFYISLVIIWLTLAFYYYLLIWWWTGGHHIWPFRKGDSWKDPWNRWFASFFEENNQYNSSSRSRYIPQQVKMQVMRRDKGTCQICGATDNLEFGHIIPFSMGGSNSANNIQIECYDCNRSKGANL